LIVGDKTDLWLVDGKFYLDDEPTGNSVLLEGMDIDEEPFEDWLRDERQRIDDSCQIAIISTTTATDRDRYESDIEQCRMVRILLQIHPLNSVNDTEVTRFNHIASRISDRLHEFSVAQIVDPHEYNLELNEIRHHDMMIDYILLIRGLEYGSEAELTCQLYHAQNVILRESASFSWDTVCVEKDVQDRVYRFIEQTAFSLAANIYEDVQTGKLASPSVFSIHNLFSPIRELQLNATTQLSFLAEESGVARAWLAYAQVVNLAECADVRTSREAIEENCARALETAPYHPIVNTLLGHIKAFFYRDYARAEEHLAIALSRSPYNSMVLSHYAASENYFGRPERGLDFAQRAIALNPNSFFRYIFDCDLQMSMALRGRHAEAALLGERVVQANPNFLGSKRYLVASYAQLGAYEKARNYALHIRDADDNFSSEGVARLDYPLPSRRSTELIADSLRTLGL